MYKTIRKRTSVIVIHDDKILGFQAQDPHNKKTYIFLPGGKIEDGEDVEQTAIRETLEETGYKISILPERRIFKKYDFEWNGQIYECETWFLTGGLKSLDAVDVDDADYHQGVRWTPLSDVDKIFSYDKVIYESIKELLA